MLNQSRTEIWQTIQNTSQWDLIIIGGGITGVGILREAIRANLRVLLIEQRDYAWGTSSRSSKLVHGGLRYLKQGQIGLTYQSVRERDHLLQEGAGLIKPLGFLMPTYEGDSKFKYKLGLSLYDWLGKRHHHQSFANDDFNWLAPRLSQRNLEGGFAFEDAQTDDARLVLRVLNEAVNAGGVALNYVRADSLLKNENGVHGVQLRDVETNETCEAYAQVVVNATGAWVDQLRADVDAPARIRPLRGSHLLFPRWRFPVAQAVSFLHPHDERPVFIFPWEGVTLIGTTDLDHDDDLDHEPHISGEEVAYLLAACNVQFPALNLTADDILATYAGVRPVIGTGKADPSQENREHVVWLEDGLLSVTGGKLTTFRLIALDALKKAQKRLSQEINLQADAPALDNPVVQFANIPLNSTQRQRLLGRYGNDAGRVVSYVAEDQDLCLSGTSTLCAELRWAAKHEQVMHLDDLLLRRTRLGLTMREGGLSQEQRLRDICQPALGWDDEKWTAEIERYRTLWQKHYSLPDAIPAWEDYVPQPIFLEASSRKWTYGIGGAVAVLLMLMIPRLRHAIR